VPIRDALVERVKYSDRSIGSGGTSPKEPMYRTASAPGTDVVVADDVTLDVDCVAVGAVPLLHPTAHARAVQIHQQLRAFSVHPRPARLRLIRNWAPVLSMTRR